MNALWAVDWNIISPAQIAVQWILTSTQENILGGFFDVKLIIWQL